MSLLGEQVDSLSISDQNTSLDSVVLTLALDEPVSSDNALVQESGIATVPDSLTSVQKDSESSLDEESLDSPCDAQTDPEDDCLKEEVCSKAECCEVWGDPYRIYVDHVEGKWLDNHDGYSSIGLFLASPLVNCNYISFLDVRFHEFNRGRAAGNVGGGFRYIDRRQLRAFGINAYYDYRKGSWRNHFQQAGIGFELLSLCLDLRVNGYLPIDSSNYSKKQRFNNFIGNFHATCRIRQSGAWGGDLELGRWIVRRCPCDFFDLYGAIGAYFYNSRSHDSNVVGGEIRLASNLGRYFNFEVKGGYDRIYHGNFQGRVTFTLPLNLSCLADCFSCCKESCCLRELAYQPVQRQEIIVLSKKECCWTWNWDDEGN